MSGFLSLTGNTPLLRLERLCPRRDVEIWVKLEQFNPGGSAKDRTAEGLVERAIATGQVSTGQGETPALVESSSGNLGMALARQALLRGWQFHCVVDPRVNTATLATIKALGATVHMVEEPDPSTGDWLAARKKKVAQLLEEIPNAVNLDQYSNTAAFDAHANGTMTEIVRDMGVPDELYVAVSTTGTIGGCMQHLHDIGADTRVVGVDAEGSVLFGGERGERYLPGFGAGVVPPLSEDLHPHRVDRIPDVQSIVGARVLAKKEGILPGASAGAVIAAILLQVPELPAGTRVAAVLHDAGQNYLDTIYNDDWGRETLGVDINEEVARSGWV